MHDRLTQNQPMANNNYHFVSFQQTPSDCILYKQTTHIHTSGKHAMALCHLVVDEMQVKSVKVKPGKRSHNGCGIDGELFPINGTVISSILPEQCRLIGRSHNKK